MRLKRSLKVVALALAVLLFFPSAALAALPNNTIIFGTKAYDLSLLNDASLADEILAAFVANDNSFAYKMPAGIFIDPNAQAVDPATLPAISYMDANKVVTGYRAGDGDVIVPLAVYLASTASGIGKIATLTTGGYPTALQYRLLKADGTALAAKVNVDSSVVVMFLNPGDTCKVELYDAAGTLLDTRTVTTQTGSSLASLPVLLTVTPSSVTLNVGQSQQITASTTPTGATITYSSSDATRATVSGTGLVTRVAAGTANITVTAAETGYTSGTAVVAVTVTPQVGRFNDANLERAVRMSIGKPEGDVTDQDMLGLYLLCASGSSIRDLRGLEYAVNLQELYLDNNAISDISCLPRSTNLRILKLQSNAISDISRLAVLTNLADLNLSNNAISDISCLAGLTNLGNLNLSNNAISDISCLAGLTNLQDLYLSNNAISDISCLPPATYLGDLYLDNNAISDISRLAGLTGLQFLWLRGNKIADISCLAALTNLRELRLSNNAISDISSLGGLTWLHHLDLSSNAISDISCLAVLTKLEHLYLQSNAISDISSLAGLTGLHYLDLSSNRIADVSPLVTNSLRGGLGDGDEVNVVMNRLAISETSAAMEHIRFLAGRGVRVTYSPQQP